MPKYVLTWCEVVENSYYTEPIEADSPEQAWELFEDSVRSLGTEYELDDYNVLNSYNYAAEEVHD